MQPAVIPATIDHQSDLSGNLPFLRAIDPNLRGCSQNEILTLLQSLPEKQQAQVFDCLRAIQGLARTGFAPLASNAASLLSTPEKERRPYDNELQHIHLSDCLVLTKMSMRDWDMRAAGCSEEELVEKYRDQGFSEDRIKRILQSHQEQQKSLQAIEQQFKDAGVNDQRVFVLNELSSAEARQLVDRASLVIALGGDDHAKAVSHLVTTDKYFCAINSDVATSKGALTSFSRTKVPELIQSLVAGNFLLQEWPRLEVEVHRGSDGSIEHYPPSLSEVILTEEESLYTLRASLNTAGAGGAGEKEIPWIHSKGSGVIVATGAGSTGWFSSAAKYIYPDGRKFPRTAKRFEFVSREPYGEPLPENELTGTYEQHETMVVRVNSKHKPIVSGDSIWVQPVKEGDEVRVSLSDKPLKVITAIG